MINRDIIFAFGLSDDETRTAVRETLTRWHGNFGLAALDYCDANPGVDIDAIIEAMRSLLDEDAGTTTCECGAITGARCAADLDDDAVTIEWMPPYLRSSHEAAGNRGVWPHNGAQRLRVTPECADDAIEADTDWVR
jgi:hypothetical protein